MGPLITASAGDQLAAWVAGPADEGAEVIVKGNAAPYSESAGFYVGATLLDRVQPGTRVYDEEIFESVLSAVRATNYDDALGLINESRYGNGCALFTRDGGGTQRSQFEVNCGMVGINVSLSRRPTTPSGAASSPVRLLHIYGLGGSRLLHAEEGRDVSLAGPGHLAGGPRIPLELDELTAGAQQKGRKQGNGLRGGTAD